LSQKGAERVNHPQGLQFGFWPWSGFNYERFDPKTDSLGLAYEWSLSLGFVRIRKWLKDPSAALKIRREHINRHNKFLRECRKVYEELSG